jgi:hypothetical protein
MFQFVTKKPLENRVPKNLHNHSHFHKIFEFPETNFSLQNESKVRSRYTDKVRTMNCRFSSLIYSVLPTIRFYYDKRAPAVFTVGFLT